ncbi:hypothetical protein HDU76_003893, partial [Blyttiomyces sp. JEL0837]
MVKQNDLRTGDPGRPLSSAHGAHTGSQNLRAPPNPSSNKQDSHHLPIEYISITSHSHSAANLAFFYAISIASFGILPIICKHHVKYWTQIARKPCGTFRDADYVLIECLDGSFEEIKVQRIRGRMLLDAAGGAMAGPSGVYDGLMTAIGASSDSDAMDFTSHLSVEVDGNGQVQGGGDGLDGQVVGGGENWQSRNRPGAGPAIERTFCFFEYKKQRYVYREGTGSFLRMNARLCVNFEDIHNMHNGMTEAEAAALLTRNGLNVIEIDSEPVFKMMLDKIVHPFYIFQICSILIWTYENYYVYAVVIAVTSVASIFWEIYQAKYNEGSLRELVEDNLHCVVLRDNLPTKISAKHLVVGDAVLITETGPAVADMVLVQGDCVVDESSLTGESVPVVKVALGIFDRQGERYLPEKCKTSTIFGGSRIVEIKPGSAAMCSEVDVKRVVGIVTATGFNSAKGDLFRSILFPTKIDFKFYKDSFKFIGALGVVAFIAFLNRMINGFFQGYGPIWVIITSLDLITIAVPPALPLVLTVGVTLALRRLKGKNIFCISPDRINFAGRVDIFCWDKTGTLTTSQVIWAGLERSRECTLSGLETDFHMDGEGDLERAVAACHSLNDVSGELVGSPIEIELFRATGWTLSQDAHAVSYKGHAVPIVAKVSRRSRLTNSATPAPSPANPAFPETLRTPSQMSFQQLPLSPTVANPNMSDPDDVFILRRFEFDAHLQRSSVLFKVGGSDRLHAVCKGSPEAIRNLCNQSTVPPNYHEAYSSYAAKGWYVLALGIRTFEDPDVVSPAARATTPQPVKETAQQLRRKKISQLGAAISASSPTSPTACPIPNTAEDIAALPRLNVERDLKFLGFVLLRNPLKAESH